MLKALSIFSIFLSLGFSELNAAESKSVQVHQITMKSISFDPKTVNIKAGESIEWVNKSFTEHSATADDGKSFDTGLIEPQKKSKQIAFATVGTFQYHCSVHGKTMHATITVY